MNRSIAGILSGIALAIVIATPAPTYAATAPFFGPIVPAACHCDNQAVQGATGGSPTTSNSAPDYGCVLAVIQNLVNFAITLSTILFTIYLVITGFSFITSAGSSEARSRAKTRFTNVFVGLVVLLCAWLVVNYVMNVLYNGTFGSWNSILAGDPAGADHCISPNQPKTITAGTVASNIQLGTSNTPGGIATGETGNSSLNVGSATQYIASHASATSGGYCARAVCNAVNAGGVSMGCANAYQLGSKLTGAGFVPVYSGVYSPSSSPSAFNYQAGDIVVFQPVPGHPYGHTAMYTGTQWISDFAQNRMDPTSNGAYTGASFTVYGP